MSHLIPHIYVSCLASYNNGILHGEWIDANQPAEDIAAGIQKILASSPIPNAEEWVIHDYEDFGNIGISEHESLELISEMAAFIAEHGALGAELLSYTNNNIEEAHQLMEECYHGEHDSMTDFAQNFIEETSTFPKEIEHLTYYIDYERMARDWVYSGDFFSINVDHKTHVFSNR